MFRRSFVLTAVVSLVLCAVALPAAAQSDPAPAAVDSLSAPVDLPAPPVSVTPAPEPEPMAAPEAAPVAAPAATPWPESAVAAPTAMAPLFNATADTLTVLVDYRAEAEIQRDLQNAVAEKAQAERRTERARMLAKLAESRIEIKVSEIKALEAEIGFAKTEKNEGKRTELEARKKYAGSEKQLLEKRRDLRQREIETARAVRAYHEATEKACRLEMDLAVNRRERASITSTVDPGAAREFNRLQVEITKLEGRVLEAQVEQAGKRKDLADQEVQLGKVRKAVFESQLKVTQGGR
ncbi:MAG: hypothetical protein IPJ24_15635 [bacterium]|nr:hypothetical protein [bacterium]